MKRRALVPIGIGFVIGLLLIVMWQFYNRRPRQRVPGQEGLEDPELAAGFDWVARTPQMRLMRWFVARHAVRMVQTGTAIDLGCGPGYLVLTLAKMGPALRVTGIDLSDQMLVDAEGQVERSGLAERVSFRKGDAKQIPFPDHSVDLVVSTFSLHHWSDPVQVMDEVARVLRPGGAFLIVDMRRDLCLPFWVLLWFATNVVVPRSLRWSNEPMASRNSAYTPEEAACLAGASRLENWHVSQGPLWLVIQLAGDCALH